MASKRDRVADAVRSAIHGGELEVGSKLPTESELASRHGVGVATVRAALAQLAHEGLIRTEHGIGSYVREQDELYRFATRRLAKENRDANRGMHLAEAELADQRPDVETRIYVEFADHEAAAALELSSGAEVLVRDRVMRIGGRPTQLAVSRYPRSLTRDTAIEDENTGPGGVLSRLEDAGHTFAPHVERVSLHRVSATEAVDLEIPVGSACIRIRRTTRSTTGRVLEVNTMTLVDRYVLIYDIPAE